MDDASPAPGCSRGGSALVVLDDQRAALATVLVLQEMGLTVDVAADREAALGWAIRAGYTVAICDGADEPQSRDFLIRLHRAAPRTRVLWLAPPDVEPDGLEEVGVELLRGPFDVNRLVERLRPSRSE